MNGEVTMQASNVYERLGVPQIINGVGYATRVGGSAPAPEVVQAMTEAHGSFIEIDDLQAVASRIIRETTDAEAGIVTCGAGAALTLAAAACLAGNRPEVMELLPDTSSLARNHIVYSQPHPYDYDHPVRLSGAAVEFVCYDTPGALARIEAAITEHTAAIGYVWKRVGQEPALREVADLAHRHGLPLIVDAALSLPPVENLRNAISDGADLVALSGGKHLGGPQASGLLFGRRDLVRSAWLQMVDMDVRARTWSLRRWVEEGFVTRPPRHGIGRSMKVSKEAMIGVLTALQLYDARNHAAELELWKQRSLWLQEHLNGMSDLKAVMIFPAPNGQPYPPLRIVHPRMPEVINALRAQRPKVLFAEDETDETVAFIFPMCLRDEEQPLIVSAFERAFATIGNNS